MNMVMGITVDFSTVTTDNLSIQNLQSNTGLTFGFATWFKSHIQVYGDFKVSDLSAGYSLTTNSADFNGMSYGDLPNKAAEACAVRIYDVEEYPVTMEWSDDSNVYQSCIAGQVGCLGSNSEYSHYLNQNVQNGVGCVLSPIFSNIPNRFDERRLFKEDNDGDFSGTENETPALEHHISNWVFFGVGLSFGMLMMVMSAIGVAERNQYFRKDQWAQNPAELQQLNTLTGSISDDAL